MSAPIRSTRLEARILETLPAHWTPITQLLTMLFDRPSPRDENQVRYRLRKLAALGKIEANAAAGVHGRTFIYRSLSQ